jgi:hypothetical protein
MRPECDRVAKKGLASRDALHKSKRLGFLATGGGSVQKGENRPPFHRSHLPER